MSACVFKCLWGGWGAALYYGSWGGRGLKVRYFLIFQQSHSCGFGLRLPLNTVQLNKHRPLSCPHILHGWCDFSKSLCILFISPKGKSNEEDAANDKILNCRSTVEKKRTLIQCCSVFSKRKIQSLFDLACDTGCINAKKTKNKFQFKKMTERHLAESVTVWLCYPSLKVSCLLSPWLQSAQGIHACMCYPAPSLFWTTAFCSVLYFWKLHFRAPPSSCTWESESENERVQIL